MKAQKQFLRTFLLILFMSMLAVTVLYAQEAGKETKNTNTLVVIWTSGDPEVAFNVCLMYTHAAKKNNWFEGVILVVWGPSAKLLSENIKLQEKLKAMQNDGVETKACIVCANNYNVTDELKNLGLDVKGMGVPLTEYLKKGYKVLTF